MYENIINFISGFDTVKDFFLNGYCYWFAKILSERFHTTIMYLPIENHFVSYSSLLNKYFDASGEVNINSIIIKWEDYKEYDHLDYIRVVKNCINKEY